MEPPVEIERRARWVLDTLGARDLGFGDDVPYVEAAWEAVRRGERPAGDELAEAFFHLARLEELGDAPRDRHGRFPAASSCLEPLDPPLERLRRRLGLEPPRWAGARFAVALTHDVDTPWRWTRAGIRGAAARLRDSARAGRAGPALREARALAAVPLHKLRGTDPNWRFERMLRIERARAVSSTFFVMAGHGHPADGAVPAVYERLRPRLVETILAGGGEVGLHGSYTAAADVATLRAERERLEALAGPLAGQRYHYLRVDPHANLAPLGRLGFRYDTSLGFADRPGFRAGIAHPFRPWDVAAGRPLDLVEIPLAVMDVTLAEERYLGLPAAAAERYLLDLVDWAGLHGGGFSVLWHSDRFDPATSRGWDRLYFRFIEAVRARGGVCLPARELAEEARAWLA
ncbi:MAG: polysaccharide deacetylase family protein [Thermoleophilia bacterium]|nr:polysaccharide deacetylase family protein [Thermoleophilia bacterium]